MKISLVGSGLSFLVLGYSSILMGSIAAGHEVLFGGFQVWMLVSLLFAARLIYMLISGTIQQKRMNSAWVFFLLLVTVNGVISILTDGGFLRASLQLVAVLSASYIFACDPPTKAEFDQVLVLIITSLCGIALLQSASYYLGLPVIGSSFYSGRGSAGFQATSIFEESAHFAGFLIAVTYYVAFATRQSKVVLMLLVVLTALATKSVGAIIGVGFLIVIASLVLRSKILLVSLVPVALIGVIFIDNIWLVLERLNREVFLFSNLLGQPFVAHGERALGSGAVRTINEANYILALSPAAFFFGHGIGYDIIGQGRLMALNGFVEMIARVGMLGLVVFLVAIFIEKRNYPSRSSMAFWVSLILLGSVDGGIAKLSFWLPVTIVLLTDRILRGERRQSASHQYVGKW